MITLELVRHGEDGVACRITPEAGAFLPSPVDLHVLARLEVRDPSGIDEDRTLHKQRLVPGTGAVDALLPKDLAAFDYHGQQIALRLTLRLTDVTGKTLAELRLRTEEGGLVGTRPKLAESPQALMNPEDKYSFFANVMALPMSQRLSVLGLTSVLWLAAATNLAVGAHDQFRAEAPLTEMQRLNLTLAHRNDELARPRVQPFFYTKGRRRLPMLDAVKLSLSLALLAALMSQRNLPRYGDFHIFERLPALRPGTRIALRRLLRGKSHADLYNVTVRVVAANLECWRRKAGRGEKQEKEIRTAVRAVKLYEKNLAYVPAGTPLGDVLKDEVDFTPMFRALYPPLIVSEGHGLDLAWQVQLLHPEFVDQILPGPTSGLRFADFLEG